MQLDAILEVAIGLVLTWLILSIGTSQLQEYIVQRLNWRSRFLENSLMDMFQSRELVDQLYNHPLIHALFTKTMFGKVQKPTDIPNDIFAQAAVDVILNAGKNSIETPAGSMNMAAMQKSLHDSMNFLQANNQGLAQAVKHIVPSMDAETIVPAVEASKLEANLAKLRSNTEVWFETAMTGASFSYRNNARIIALLIGFVLAWVFNIDSLNITDRLWRDPTLRQAIVAQASNIDPKDEAGFNNTAAKLNELALPIGWVPDAMPQNPAGWAFKVFGFFITGAAAAQGAPFWFDILAKLSGYKKSRDDQKSKSQ
ncbi:MAG TPA: hypothetical protein VN653_14090 [Anaerolineales bacterium]|nr:hypothetical protein [Anaerolineales bacterium]